MNRKLKEKDVIQNRKVDLIGTVGETHLNYGAKKEVEFTSILDV